MRCTLCTDVDIVAALESEHHPRAQPHEARCHEPCGPMLDFKTNTMQSVRRLHNPAVTVMMLRGLSELALQARAMLAVLSYMFLCLYGYRPCSQASINACCSVRKLVH